MSDTLDRKSVLEDLLALRRPLAAVEAKLRRFDWDCKEPLVSLGSVAVESVLTSFVTGNLTPNEVENWANAIESRDDIDTPDQKALEILHSLANPALEGSLSVSKATRMIRDLKRRI
ncbi:MAG: hypothetical protein AAF604_12005 [Acidobacteriota bacterium]